MPDTSLSSSSTPSRQGKKETFNNIHGGGRALSAIWRLDFKPLEKLILQYIGSDLDFTSDFLQPRYIRQKRIQENTGLKKDAVNTHLLNLEKNRYLDVKRRPGQCNIYRLTQKLFDEYSDLLSQDRLREKEQKTLEHDDTPEQTICPTCAKNEVAVSQSGAKNEVAVKPIGGSGKTDRAIGETDTKAPSNAPSNTPSINIKVGAKPQPDTLTYESNTKKTAPKRKKPNYKYNKYDMELAKSWQAPKWVKRDHEAWANEFRLIREQFDISDEGLYIIIDYARSDSFWSKQLQSPIGLRKKSSSNGIHKIMNVKNKLYSARDHATNAHLIARMKEAFAKYDQLDTSNNINAF